MFPEDEIDGFEKYWRRRKPGKSTSVHYASDVRIFLIAHRSIHLSDKSLFVEP